ncbi:hypothetical protein M0804_010195 [Polistes exclamans]|nr:hypothetical protein M0804_010195 [Polistes exclamans]
MLGAKCYSYLIGATSRGLLSLLDVVIERNLMSISIAETRELSDIIWRSIEKIMKDLFSDLELLLIICNSLRYLFWHQQMSRRAQNSTSLEKLFKQAWKKLGYNARSTSGVPPNLVLNIKKTAGEKPPPNLPSKERN